MPGNSHGNEPEDFSNVAAPASELTTGTLAFPSITAGFLAGSGLLLQLTQTRIYSVVYWNHVVYFIVSIALLGFGISGTWLSFGQSTRIARFLTLPRAATGFVVTALLSSFHVPNQTLGELFSDYPRLAALLLTYSTAVLPYFFLGWMLGTIYRDNASRINTIYFADLTGAATGCLLFLLLIRPVGAVGLVLTSAVLCAGPAFLQIRDKMTRVRAVSMLMVLIFVVIFTRQQIEQQIIPEPTKGFNARYADLQPGDEKIVELSEWNAISRIDVVSTKKNPNFKRIFIDGDAYTRMAIPGAIETLHIIDMAYTARPEPNSVLVIGPGGGYDVLRAVEAGATHTDAVEINPTTARIMLGPYSKATLDLFRRDDVSLYAEEGRSFIRRSNRSYDLITMTCIDTFAALSSGAYVLSENYLYTVDSFKDFIAHLTPGGIILVTRWSYEPEAVRLFGLALEALNQSQGITGAPEQCLTAYGNDNIALFVSNQPFTAEDFQRMDAFAERVGAQRWYPRDPEATESNLADNLQRYAQANAEGNLDEFLATFDYDVTPVGDDNPFFFHYDRLFSWYQVFQESTDGGTAALIRGHWPSFTLIVLLVVMSVAVIVFIGAPLLSRGAVRTPRFPIWIIYFAALGVSFIFVEIAIMQRLALLLGHPIRSIALVLAGLLVSAGIGSQLGRPYMVRQPLMVFIPLIVAILASAFLYPIIIDTLLVLPLPARAVAAIILVAMLGFWMGIPFPTALGLVSSQNRDAVPWMWGVNGGCTVLGSISAIALAIEFGFTTVLLLAAIGYAVAGLCYRVQCRS